MGLRLRPLLALVPAAILAAGLAATAVEAAAPGSRDRATTGSSGTSGSTTTTTPGPPRILSGGTVTVAVPDIPTQLNPATVAGANPVTAEIMAQVWPSAFVTPRAGDQKAQTAFIDSAEVVSVSPQKVVYTIDPKARWSDGTPITAADFIAEWRAQLALGDQLPANDPLAGYEDISSITSSSGGKVVTVTFAEPDADWEALFRELAPAQVAARYGWTAAFAGGDLAHLVSGGPFEIARIVPGREMVLQRNPSWWGTPATISRIVFTVVRGQAALLRGLEQGAIDVAEVQPGPGLRNALMGYRFLAAQTSLSPRLWQLEFNLADPTMGQLVVRRAVATAIDRPELAADSVGLLRNNIPLSGNHLYEEGAPGSAGNGGDYAAVDVPLADQLLGEAGYHLDSAGILRSAAGRPLVLRLTVPSSGALVSAITAQLRAQLLDAGIVVRLARVPLAQLLAKVLPQGAYQMALAPQWVSPFPSENAAYYVDPVGPLPTTNPFALPPAPGTPSTTTTTTTLPATTLNGPPASGYAAARGSRADPGSLTAGSVTRDVLGYDDPAVQALLVQAFSALNPGPRIGLYNQADRLIWADLPSLPLFQVPTALVKERSLLDVHDSPTWMGPLWNAQSWALQAPTPPPAGTSPGTSSGGSTGASSGGASGGAQDGTPGYGGGSGTRGGKAEVKGRGQG